MTDSLRRMMLSPAARPDVRLLFPATLAYLCLPILIFLAGWVRWIIAIPAGGLVIFSGLRLVREERAAEPRSPRGLLGSVLPPLALSCMAALLVLCVSGVGGYGPQESDWLKHNAILKDLIERPWPVLYSLGGREVPLVYYLAYYLPAAVAGKCAGWDAANEVLFAWSLVGLVLVLWWFTILVRRQGVGVMLLFFAFSGMDIAGVAVVSSRYASWRHIEWWSQNWSYPSDLTHLWWAPHIAIAGWLLAALVLDSVQHRRGARNGLFYLGLSLLWSPFLTLGLLPYLAAGFLRHRDIAGGMRTVLSRVPTACGIALVALFGLYYASKIPVAALPGGPPLHGWIFVNPLTAQFGAREAAFLLLFCLAEFACLGVLIRISSSARETTEDLLFWVTMVLLTLLPLYRLGRYNDLVMRASIPAMFTLAALCGRALFAKGVTRRWRTLIALVLLLGAVTPLIELKRHAGRIFRERTINYRPRPSDVRDLPTLHREVYLQTPEGASFLGQYTGNCDTPFFRYLASR